MQREPNFVAKIIAGLAKPTTLAVQILVFDKPPSWITGYKTQHHSSHVWRYFLPNPACHRSNRENMSLSEILTGILNICLMQGSTFCHLPRHCKMLMAAHRYNRSKYNTAKSPCTQTGCRAQTAPPNPPSPAVTYGKIVFKIAAIVLKCTTTCCSKSGFLWSNSS